MNPRQAVAALLLPLLLAAAGPAPAVVSVKPFWGGSHGPAQSKPGSNGAKPNGDPGANGAGTHAPEGAQGTPAQAGTKGGPSGRSRPPHPELLREAAALPPHEDAQAKAEAQAREHDEAYAPWASEPRMRVRQTGDTALDAVLLRRLNAELRTAIDPDRVRAASLADDALADDALARLSPRKPDEAQKRLWRFLREHPPHLDLVHLTQELRALKGDTLLVMGHIDQADGALVFKADNGRPLRLPLGLFQQAARNAGVQLVTLGCKSARHSSAGFVDNLNSLDAARAMAQALHSRPSTLWDLYSALTGPGRVMQFDAATFEATHTADITAGPDGQLLSTLHWSGPASPAALRSTPSAASAPEQSAAAPAAPPIEWGNPALRVVALVLLLSCAAGALLAGLGGNRGAPLVALLGLDLLAHALLAPLLLTVLAEAVAGTDGPWWAWGAALLLGLAAVALAVVAANRKPIKPDLPAMDTPVGAAAARLARQAAGSDSHVRAWLALLALRLGLATAPFAAVALLHTGWVTWPHPLLRGLLALYGLGRPLPGPWLMMGIALALFWSCGVLLQVVKGVQQRLHDRRGRAGRARLWRDQLAADGVTGATARHAVAARLAFERRCAVPLPREARWAEAKVLHHGHAPDPWAARPGSTAGGHRAWQLLAVPLLAPGGSEAHQVGFGLVRSGSPFMHPVPPVLVQRWRAQDLQPAEVNALLAQLEPQLRWTDFLPPGEGPKVRALILWGLVFSALFAGLALSMPRGSGEERFGAGLAALLLLVMVLWPGARWLRRRWRSRRLQRIRPQPAQAAEAGQTAAAT